MPHIHELIDFTVGIFIVHDSKVLLIKHKKLNKWLAIGGHIELNEDPDEALFREVKEECGLEIKVLNNRPAVKSEGVKFLYAPSFLNIHKITETHRHIVLVYFAEAESDKFVFNKEEHNDIKWFSEEDLKKPEFNILPEIKFGATEAIKAVENK